MVARGTGDRSSLMVETRNSLDSCICVEHSSSKEAREALRRRQAMQEAISEAGRAGTAAVWI